MKPVAISIVLAACLFSCAEEVVESPSKIKFVQETVYYSEFEGIFFVPLELDKPQFSYINIDFTTEFPNSSTSNKDFYYINNLLPLTIYGGLQTARISGSVFDDDLPDGNDTVEFILTEATSNVTLPSAAKERTGRVVFLDDDNLPADKMLIQMKWDAEKARNDREDVDFDLFLLSNVVMGDGIESSKTVASSKNRQKFESLSVDESLPDGEYYIMLEYKSHAPYLTGPADPLIKISGFGYKDNGENLWGFRFEHTQVDWYGWIGPFEKKGRSFLLKE